MNESVLILCTHAQQSTYSMFNVCLWVKEGGIVDWFCEIRRLECFLSERVLWNFWLFCDFETKREICWLLNYYLCLLIEGIRILHWYRIRLVKWKRKDHRQKWKELSSQFIIIELMEIFNWTQMSKIRKDQKGLQNEHISWWSQKIPTQCLLILFYTKMSCLRILDI
jgi:hypothetical protein